MVDDVKADAQTPELVLRKLYIKDLSFESPRPTEALIEADVQHGIDFDANTRINKVNEDLYEVTLRITIAAIQKDIDKTLYLIEVSQAGLFAIKGLDDARLAETLNSRCSGILLPFVRETISSVITQGGFPPLLLQPIQFDQLYRQYLDQLTTEDGTGKMESDPEQQLKSESK